MKQRCINHVSRIAGRALTQTEIDKIDAAISGTMQRMARTDPNWQSKSLDQRILDAAGAAINDLLNAAIRKKENAQRQIIATLKTERQIQTLQKRLGKGRSNAFVEHLVNVGNYIEGTKKKVFSELMDLIDGATSGEGASLGKRTLQFLFDAENPAMTRDLVSEIFGNANGHTGNTIAIKAAKAWLESIEKLRVRFNNAGGDVRKIDYGYLPQAHDAIKIREAGIVKWVDSILPRLDRSRYRHEDGRLMSDLEMKQFLAAAWETLATDGLNKQTPGAFKGAGARANAGSEHRLIHFKDGESYLSYNAEYGAGSVFDAMLGHIGGLSRDIGLVEMMGPNPNQQFRLQNDLAKLQDLGVKRTFGNFPQAYWDILNGTTGSPDSAKLAQVGQHIRNIQTFGKLAGAVISSITDIGTILVSTGYNKLSYWDLLKNISTAGGKESQDFANIHGMIAESLIHDFNRFQGEFIANNWSGRLANSTMKLSFMNAWTDTMRRGFSLTMQAGLGKISKTAWAKLDEFDRDHLERKGITEEDWDVVNASSLTLYHGQQMLTPDAIAASGHARSDQVISKILGFITDESEFAVVNPDLKTRVVQTWGGTQAGTVKGELARSVMQFKSFPMAMISRHYGRMMEGGRDLQGTPILANKLAYTAALMLSTTLLGAIAFQTKQIVQGKDPVDMTSPKFWVRAAAQGGGAGFLSDMLLGDTTQDRSTMDTMGRLLLGPTFGSLADIYEITKGNIDEALAEKDTHIGAETLRFAKSHSPYVNLWYGKAAFDHMFLHAAQENLSPGYLARQKDRARKDWGQEYYWPPGEDLPQRPPDMSAIGGR